MPLAASPQASRGATEAQPRRQTRRMSSDGGEGGIRTHVPFRTRRFRGAPVTTTSVPLRSEWTAVLVGTLNYISVFFHEPNRLEPQPLQQAGQGRSRVGGGGLEDAAVERGLGQLAFGLAPDL
jgi:hypothetical protein